MFWWFHFEERLDEHYSEENIRTTQGNWKTFLFEITAFFHALCRRGKKAVISKQETFSTNPESFLYCLYSSLQLSNITTKYRCQLGSKCLANNKYIETGNSFFLHSWLLAFWRPMALQNEEIFQCTGLACLWRYSLIWKHTNLRINLVDPWKLNWIKHFKKSCYILGLMWLSGKLNPIQFLILRIKIQSKGDIFRIKDKFPATTTF